MLWPNDFLFEMSFFRQKLICQLALGVIDGDKGRVARSICPAIIIVVIF